MKFSKKHIERVIREVAKDYIFGVKKPGRVANQYSLIKEQEEKISSIEAQRRLRELADVVAGGTIDEEEKAFIINLTELMINYSSIKNLTTNTVVMDLIDRAAAEMKKGAVEADEDTN